jgi:hypothetical protein
MPTPIQSITAHFASMAEGKLITEQVAHHVEFTQNESIFRLARLKSQRLQILTAKFANRQVTNLYIGSRLASMEFKLTGMEVSYLPSHFFCHENVQERQKKQAFLENSIVLLNNNDVAFGNGSAHYADLYNKCQNTIFLIWDWDNHHWMDSSLFLAVHSDLYFPAHNENMYLLSRLNWLIAGPVPCGTIQWSRPYLAQSLAFILQSVRKDDPLGMHIFYPQFIFRNQTVVTLKQHYETIGFSSAAFHNRSAEDRLNEWCAHKSHWIIPVLNDVPLRIFDALVTGGIPIVPESLRFLTPVCSIPRNHIVFYGPDDILEPRAVVARANALFDTGGADGLTARHRLGLEHHHGDARIRTILHMAQEKLGFSALLPDSEFTQ